MTGEEACTATADQIERGLFSLLLALGLKLLGLLFVMRSQACKRDKHLCEDGVELPYPQDKKRDYLSIFGKLPFFRPYFYKEGLRSATPLDAELSLGEDCYPDLVRETSEYLGVYTVYGKACDILTRILGFTLSTRAMQDNLAEYASDVEAYYAQKSPPSPKDEAEILVIQADGKGVPLILETPAEEKVRLGKGEKRGRKKEAIVTSAYTIAANPRTPAEVVAGYFEGEKYTSQPPKPQNKHIRATLDGKDTALTRLSKQVDMHQGDHIRHKVALCEGCEALQSRSVAQFSDFVLILDFIRADEYLWKVANRLLGETNDQRFTWMAQQTLRMLSGETQQMIHDFRQLAHKPITTQVQREQLLKTANYFERNLPYMDYPTYLTNGWPIASGVIEGACRHLVKDRCELSGMRWLQSGAENLLRLRAVAEHGDWDTYHHFRRRKRHLRLYDGPIHKPQPIETQAINSSPLNSNPKRSIVVSAILSLPFLPGCHFIMVSMGFRGGRWSIRSKFGKKQDDAIPEHGFALKMGWSHPKRAGSHSQAGTGLFFGHKH